MGLDQELTKHPRDPTLSTNPSLLSSLAAVSSFSLIVSKQQIMFKSSIPVQYGKCTWKLFNSSI